jgi:hypothetical protein
MDLISRILSTYMDLLGVGAVDGNIPYRKY